MNYVEKIANMLGLDIGEKFKIKGHPDMGTFWFVDDNSEKLRDIWDFKLGPETYDLCFEPAVLLEQILTGFYEVEKLPWKPKRCQKYYTFHYTLESNEEVIDENIWIDSAYDLMRWKSGNCFETRKKAELNGKEIVEQLREEYEEA